MCISIWINYPAVWTDRLTDTLAPSKDQGVCRCSVMLSGSPSTPTCNLWTTIISSHICCMPCDTLIKTWILISLLLAKQPFVGGYNYVLRYGKELNWTLWRLIVWSFIIFHTICVLKSGNGQMKINIINKNTSSGKINLLSHLAKEIHHLKWRITTGLFALYSPWTEANGHVSIANPSKRKSLNWWPMTRCV